MPTPTIVVQSDSTGTTISTLPPTGQANSANSLPVVIATDQNGVKVDTVVQATSTSRSAIIPCGAASAAVASGGSGYAVNDTITLTGGTNSAPAVLRVTTVSSGAITAVTVQTAGSYTALPSNPVAQASTSGMGTGATFTVVWASIPTQIAAANAARRVFQVQPQGAIAYMSGIGTASADQNSMKLPADALYESLPQHVGTGAISIVAAVGVPLPVYARES